MVSETFLLMCIKAGKVVDHTKYLLEKASNTRAKDPGSVSSSSAAPEVREDKQNHTKAAKKAISEHHLEESTVEPASGHEKGFRTGRGAPEDLDLWSELLAMRLSQLSALRKMPIRERFRNRGLVRRRRMR